MKNFEKIVRIGTMNVGYRGPRWVSVYAKIKLEGPRFTVNAVVGPRMSGNAVCCGRIASIVDTAKDEIRYNKGWDERLLKDLQFVESRWHLNDMRPTCEHQRELGWTYDTHRGRECPVCEYEIGTKWTPEPLPESIVKFVESLPETDQTPAWC